MVIRFIGYLVDGWAYPSEKYEFVSWDNEIPNWMEKRETMFQTTNQPLINGGL